MVFHSHSKSETPPPNTQNSNQQQQQDHHHQQHQQHHNHNHMSSSSSAMKSQPLHNFSLPDLKWAMNHTNRLRKSTDPSNQSPQSDSDSDSETHNNPTPNQTQTQTQAQAQTQSPVLCEGVSNLKIEKSEKKVSAAVGAAAADHAVENNNNNNDNNNNNNNNSEKKSTATDGGARSKLLIRFRTKNGKNVEEVPAEGGGDQGSVAEFVEDSMPKTWNLRPRKPVTKGSKTAGGGAAGQEAKPHPNSSRPESTRSRHAGADAKDKKDKGKEKEKEKEKEKDKRPKFSITLTKEEIEEDIFAMTGAKPSRRPKKRNKNVQKQLDVVFPGLWLSSITPDSYKVHDTPSKLPKN